MNILAMLFMCHKRPDRSFFFRGKQFPVCARCTGIILGYILGIIYIIYFKRNRMILYMSMISFGIPLLIDGIYQLCREYVSTNLRRLITGILAGISVDIFFYVLVCIGIHLGNFIKIYFQI